MDSRTNKTQRNKSNFQIGKEQYIADLKHQFGESGKNRALFVEKYTQNTFVFKESGIALTAEEQESLAAGSAERDQVIRFSSFCNSYQPSHRNKALSFFKYHGFPDENLRSKPEQKYTFDRGKQAFLSDLASFNKNDEAAIVSKYTRNTVVSSQTGLAVKKEQLNFISGRSYRCISENTNQAIPAPLFKKFCLDYEITYQKNIIEYYRSLNEAAKNESKNQAPHHQEKIQTPPQSTSIPHHPTHPVSYLLQTSVISVDKKNSLTDAPLHLLLEKELNEKDSKNFRCYEMGRIKISTREEFADIHNN